MKKYNYITSLLSNDKEYQENETSARPAITYTQESLEFVKLLAVGSPKNAKIFGSYIYKNHHTTASDLDIFETYQKSTLDKTTHEFYKEFKVMLKRVLQRPLIYYSEVKCGIDERFNFDIGECHLGVYTPTKGLLTSIDNKKRLFDLADYKILMKVLSKSNLTGDDYDVVTYTLRKYYILRWSLQEVMQGYKILNHTKFMFTYGLTQNSLVKIDVWSYLNSKIIEVTNTFFLSYGKKDVKEIQDSNKIESLTKEIEKLYYSNMWYSPFKMIKRIYALARQIRDETADSYQALEKILEVSSKLLDTRVSTLYQIKAELDTYEAMLSAYGKEVETEHSFMALDNIKTRLSHDLALTEKLLIKWCHDIDNILSSNSVGYKQKAISELSQEIKHVIEAETVEMLSDALMNPPPRLVLPDDQHFTYDPKIIRNSKVYVQNPLKKYDMLIGGHTEADYFKTLNKSILY